MKLEKNFSLLDPVKKQVEEGKQEIPSDYDVFSDIKQSYERTTGKLVQQVTRLKEEVLKERRTRIKCEKVAEEVTLTEK